MMQLFASFFEMSKETESSVAMWAALSAIVIAFINIIPTCMSAWFAYKSKVKTEEGNKQNAEILKVTGKTNELVAENTDVTEKTAKRVNGVLDAAKSEAHELGYMKGKADALSSLGK